METLKKLQSGLLICVANIRNMRKKIGLYSINGLRNGVNGLKKGILAIVAFCIMFLMASICSAHWMPESEMYVGGIGPGCTMSYVESIYGEPTHRNWFNTDGVRGVTYNYGNEFFVTGRTWSNDRMRKENDLPVVGYRLLANNLSTPSGFTVSVPIKTVAGMYGWGRKFQYRGKLGYTYEFPYERSMTFYVDSYGNINEIALGTDF